MVVPLPLALEAMVNIEQDKASQRRIYRQRRDEFVAALSEAEKSIAFSRLPSPLRSLLASGMVIAGYIAKDSEADPSRLLAEAGAIGHMLALPYVTSRSAPMRFLSWRPGDPLIPGPFGLLQPAADSPECTPDIVLTPLVAFDRRLMRLGQGAGHYDRALSLLGDAIAVGIAWDIQEAPSVFCDPWDVPMDAILTEKSWIAL